MQIDNKNEARSLSGLFSSNSLKALWQQAANLVFPPCCLHCGRVDYDFCHHCQQALLSLPIDPIRVNAVDEIPIMATYYHEGILQAAAQALKYQGQVELGSILAKRLVATLKTTNWQFDTVIPVPLHTSRLAKRGYNQAKEISLPFANLWGCDHNDSAIMRQKNTQSQVTLTREERQTNLEEAFVAQSPTLLHGKSVLLVDDVTTTGSTLQACAHAARMAGAQQVYGATITAARFQN